MNSNNCTVKGCEQKHQARGFCHTHYMKKYRGGDLDLRKNHGMHNTSTYHSWQCMKDRCYRKANIAYSYYGEKGISVCDRWKDSFINFLEDMGEAPKGFTIDRVDGSKGYNLSNCRWATKSEQSYNKRKQSNNKTGIVGVWFDKARLNWQVSISFNKKVDRIGRYDIFLDACCARKSAELRLSNK